MSQIMIDVWLYGILARYGGSSDQGSFANPQVRLASDATIADLLAALGLPTEERGITFVNGQLSAMPGLQPDLGHVLQDGCRVALFDLKSMWPFHYRHGVVMTAELANATAASDDGGMHHTFRGPDAPE
jgi:hypothetical protein